LNTHSIPIPGGISFSHKNDISQRLLQGVAPSRGQVVPVKRMVKEYYKIKGWDEKGVPRD